MPGDGTTTGAAGTKRKRASEPKFYVVRAGFHPGIYHSWADCLNEVTGYKKAEFKSFTSLTDAESFLQGGHASIRSASKGPQKFYGVQTGRVPGVYTDWDSASAQITGWQKPRYKAFSSRAEAEAFVKEGASSNPTGASVPNGRADTGSPAPNGGKPPGKKQKKKGAREGSEPAHEDTTEYEPGEGPLPPDAEDGFDPRITLNPVTGKVEYKNDAQMNTTRWKATGPTDDGVLRIYTDGSSLSNGQAGAVAGVGVFFGPNDTRNISEALEGTRQTNQRAELTAILRALELSPRDRAVTIFSDSSYAINCVTTWFQKWRSNGWVNAAKKPVENRDLIEKVLALLEERESISRRYASEDLRKEASEDSKDEEGVNETLRAKGRSRVQFIWVKGHKDDAGNIAADRLAVDGAREAKDSAAKA